MEIIVAKFGGSSLANSNQFKKVKDIVMSNPNRKYIVPSAPGKEHSDDTKITDLLYLLFDLANHKIAFNDILELIEKRYIDICKGIDLDLDLTPYFQEITENLYKGTTRDYVASRGEYLNGVILSKYLDIPFIDPVNLIFFDEEGNFLSDYSYNKISEMKQKHERAVIPGFYGSLPDGSVKTFTRGGGDLTGSIIARGVTANIYENWTDVSGFLAADPKIVNNPRHIDYITYKELRELSYMGAGVLHDEAIFPVISEGIPIQIKNTNAPEDEGTLIVQSLKSDEHYRRITGIAGRKNFTVINIEKVQMNSDKSFHRKLMSVLEVNDIYLEHMPSSIDSISLIVADKYLHGKSEILINEIKTFCNPDSITLHSNIALIAVVGRGMINHVGASAKLFIALAENDVNIQMIIQGSSEMNIIVGIDNNDYEKGINAIYAAFED